MNNTFNKGDRVKISSKLTTKEFKRNADAYGSRKDITERFINGEKFVVGDQPYDRDIRIKGENDDDISNYYLNTWFELATELDESEKF